MAEWAIKIGDSKTPGRYQDGDVVDVFNRRRTRLCHADMICHPRVNGKKVGGQLGTAYPLLEKYLQRQHRYKWERVSRTEVKRTNLWVGGEIVYGATPIEDPDRPGHIIHCDAEEHFSFRNRGFPHLMGWDRAEIHSQFVAGDITRVERNYWLAYFDHNAGALPIFGADGAEVEYGDRMKRDAATTELIWDDIETDTPLRRVDHDMMPLGEEAAPALLALALLPEQAKRLRAQGVSEPFALEYFSGDREYRTGAEGDVVTAILGGRVARHFLWITVDEFDDAEAEELKAPLTEEVAVSDEFPDGIRIIQKRKHHVDWQGKVAASLSNSANVADVEDRTKQVDIRAEETFDRSSIQQTKSV